ncbi:MAG: HD domain-containing protein [Candidatus Eremiobacteraeota bacterium]|nr:HD domain-containing protein [Candidatus Eremiobacteraeota bacterium]
MEMNRLMKVQQRVLEILLQHPLGNEKREAPKEYELSHLFGILALVKVLSRKRGACEEDASLMAVLHDLGRIVSGVQDGHALRGEGPAREVLEKTGEFSREEIEKIVKGVTSHSSKDEVGTAEEETVKDADILDYYLFGIPVTRESHRRRLRAVLNELGLQCGDI